MGENIIASDQLYSKRNVESLELLFGMVIPASDDGRFPVGSDPIIFQDFLAASERFHKLVLRALELLHELSGIDYRELTTEARDEVTRNFYANRSAPVSTLLSLMAHCYYRDDRVLQAIGQEPRAPHPKGYVVEQGDWGLLEPVKQRGKIYRDV